MAPGMKATELSPKVRIFRLVFSKGDDVAAGLAEFAKKNHLTDAHFSAIGAFGSAVIGWSDRPKKAFKVVRINEEMEVSAFNGNITRDQDGKPVVHAHCVVGLLQQRHGLCRPLPARRSQPDHAALPDGLRAAENGPAGALTGYWRTNFSTLPLNRPR